MYRALPMILMLATSCRCTEDDAPREKARVEDEASEPAEVPEPSATPEQGTAGPGNARFRVDGEWVAATTDASAVAWMSGEVLVRIEIETSQDYRRREKLRFNVQLRLPRDFRPKPGEYPIAPDFARRADAVGATLVAHTDYITVMAGDPTGTLTITAASAAGVAGKFEFEIWDKADHTKHPRVRSAKLRGNFTAAPLAAGRR